MEKLKLVLPSEEYLDQVWAYREEALASGGGLEGCGPLRRCDSVEQWLAETRLYLDSAAIPEGKVQATQFLTVRVFDGRLVGLIQVRHTLNEELAQAGGHIGYSIRVSERRKGYAKEQLRLVLPFCKSIGLDKVLITCAVDNEGSRRVILSQGGAFDGTAWSQTGGKLMERYWIAL